MTSLADRTISALRTVHDELAALVPGLTDAQLEGPSGASEWTIAQVLSHLGSGSEIMLAGLTSTLSDAPAPEPNFNQGVWDRWNALAPRQQAAGFLEHDAIAVDAFEAIPGDQRETLTMELGFLPFPLPIAAVAGMRLNETALHTWDVQVALSPASGLDAGVASVLAEQFAGGLSFLLGFIGKADALSTPAVVTIQDSGFGIAVGEGVTLIAGVTNPTATFTGPLESAVRLLGGRLTPQYTPQEVAVSGAISLDDLRRVFPGY